MKKQSKTKLLSLEEIRAKILKAKLGDEEMKVVISENLGLLDDVSKAPELLFKVAQAQSSAILKQFEEE